MPDEILSPPKISRKKKRKYHRINTIDLQTGEVSKWYTISDFGLEKEEDRLREEGKRIHNMFRIIR